MFLPQPTEGGNFEPAPAGTHVAICYRVIDLGTQESVYNGEKKSARKVLISWELPNEEKADGKPFVISATYTWSMHEKSTLRKTLEAWRGAAPPSPKRTSSHRPRSTSGTYSASPARCRSFTFKRATALMRTCLASVRR